MRVIDKNNLPQDIIDDETKFNETTFLLYRDHQLVGDEIHQYFDM